MGQEQGSCIAIRGATYRHPQEGLLHFPGLTKHKTRKRAAKQLLMCLPLAPAPADGHARSAPSALGVGQSSPQLLPNF